MMSSQPFKIQRFLILTAIYLLVMIFFFCPKLWASQAAMVLADRAIIYSDIEMTSPLGYVPRGKKIVVGEIPRNKAQVYPIMVSGRVGYIRVMDITTEKESMDSQRLVAERFTKSAQHQYKTNYVLSYLNFNSSVQLDHQNAKIASGDSLMWNGVSLKGDVLLGKSWDLQIITNYMQTSMADETFRVMEFGLGGALRLINTRHFILRAEADFLAVPFSRYDYLNKVHLNSYGGTLGGGINGTYLWDNHWGLEAGIGFYYTKLMGFKDSTKNSTFQNFSPTFTGSRVALGLNYSY